MRSYKILLNTLLTILVFTISGCGSNSSPDLTAVSTLEPSQACINCHESTAFSSVTDEKITESWQASAHNTASRDNKTKKGASCGDCHEPAAGHPNNCAGCHAGGGTPTRDEVVRNPDSSLKCGKCHGRSFPNDVLMINSSTHFRVMKLRTNRFTNGTTNRASYVSGQYTGKCRVCHDPHNPTGNIAYNQAWAQGGMGDANAGPFKGRDFKSFGTDLPANIAYFTTGPAAAAGNSNGVFSPGCVRCHTTTGFNKFVSSGFMDLKPFGNDLSTPYTSASDLSKEVIACDACHTDYSFARKSIPAVTIYYNFSAASTGPPETRKYNNHPVTFQNIGPSNMCIPCHAGRGVGSVIKDPDGLTSLATMGLNFANTNSPSGHDFSGAAMLMAKSGYEFPGKEYRTGTGSVTRHDDPNAGGGRGPCITCHMNSNEPESHHFMTVEHGSIFRIISSTRTWSQLYSVSANSPGALTIQNLTSNSCNNTSCHAGYMTKSTLNEDKEGYISALAALNKWVRLVQRVPLNGSETACVSNTNYPRSLTKWDYYGSGPDVMGAAFNLGLMNNEPGSYVHNPLYARRLVYDSIEFLMASRPDVPQNVADAIQWLVANLTLTYTANSGVSGAALRICTNYNTSTTAEITQHQADFAIKWLYGIDRTALITLADRQKRPGDP